MDSESTGSINLPSTHSRDLEETLPLGRSFPTRSSISDVARTHDETCVYVITKGRASGNFCGKKSRAMVDGKNYCLVHSSAAVKSMESDPDKFLPKFKSASKV